MAGTRPKVVETASQLRAAVRGFRGEGAKVALVPTMGALHAGHVALVRRAREIAGRSVVSIFVNPTQFGPTEDFSRYPRTFEADLDKLADVRADLVYAPAAADMYPQGFATRIEVGGPSQGLETDFRPHFFGGVATVVAKLFIHCMPDYALFGEKDYQQLKVVTRLSRDLDLGVQVVGMPTNREAVIHHALNGAAEMIRAGGDPTIATAQASERIAAAGLRVDYVAARNAETLAPLAGADEPVRLLAAAWLGTTRLIDNIPV
jgi:pantoate--beta-alanine ligase